MHSWLVLHQPWKCCLLDGLHLHLTFTKYATIIGSCTTGASPHTTNSPCAYSHTLLTSNPEANLCVYKFDVMTGMILTLRVSFGDFHLFLLSYFFLSRSTLLTINLLQLHSSIVALDAP